jgi:hypothetical protein
MNGQRSKGIQLSSRPFAAQLQTMCAFRGRSGSRPRAIRVLPLTLALLLLASVPLRSQEPSKKQDKLLTQESGFLGDVYSKLGPDPGNSDWLIYFRNPDVLKKSNTFLLEPVKIFFVPEVQQRDIDPADQAKIAGYFTRAINDALLAGHYNLVTEPGPGVMVLRLAITNVEPNGGKSNAVASGTEAVVAHAVVPVPGASELVPRLKVGKVSIEGEMVDSASGEVEMAFMTSKSGRRFFSGLKAFQKWGDIDAAFRSWAKNLRQRLDKAHAS